MKPLIVTYRPLPDDVTARSREHIELVQVDGAETLIEALTKAEDTIGASPKVTLQMLDHVSRLKAWLTISVGYDNFDVPGLTRQGIVLAHTPDVLMESTIDIVFSPILPFVRRIVELAEWVRTGDRQRSIGPEFYGTNVQGKTIGIVGLGQTGTALARHAAYGFRMHVLYTNRHPYPEVEAQYGTRRMTLDTLLVEANSVCLQVPLTPEMQHLIGAAELAEMKRNTILTNASRGAIVDEAAFIDALRNGMIRGIELDVFEREPLPANPPLPTMSSVVALSHIGSATRET